MLKVFIAFIICVVSLLVLIALFSSDIERTLIYWPSRKVIETPANYGVNYESLELESPDGTKLVAWVVPYDPKVDTQDSEDLSKKSWLIYFHGNDSNISYHLDYTLRLADELQVNLLLVEYRGFFKSEGKADEKGIVQDAQTYYNYLIDQDITGDDIILYGYSLGSGIATDLATKVDIAALILEAPYTSIPDAAKAAYGPWLPVDIIRTRFPSIEKIASIDAPLFIIHGEQDRTIPFVLGKQLFEAGVEPKVFRPFVGNHVSLVEGQYPEITSEIRGFLEQNGAIR